MAQSGGTLEREFFANLVDRAVAADLIGVSPRTLDRWHLLREGPPRILVGRQVRYRMSAIEEWLLEHESGSLRRN